MTQPDLIQKLIEQLLAEREKNIRLQLQLEEIKKGKDQMCHYIVGSKEVVTRFPCFLFLDIKKVCAVTIHIRANNIHNQTEGTLLNVTI